MNENAHAVLRLFLTSGIGIVTYKKLLSAFGSPLGILGAPHNRLTEIQGIGDVTASSIVSAREKTHDRAEKEIELAESYNVKIYTTECEGYPKALLANVCDPPLVLYVRGEILPSDAMALGVVGTRAATRYGLRSSEELSGQMASRGYTIVSGLARGIDSAAHRGALEAGGRTIAVLGTGLANVYPAENIPLAKEIVERGAVISEFPMRTAPARENFPRRNRVISGLSLGVLVVEGKLRSGAMITARYALEQGREVFALPGQVTSPLSAGPHQLIQQGAKLVTNQNDITEEIGPSAAELGLREVAIGDGDASETSKEEKGFADPASYTGLSPQAKKLLALIPIDPINIDDIAAASNMTPEDILTNLFTLEMQNLIRQLPGKRFLRLA